MRVWGILLFLFAVKVHAFSWQDLWVTKDQQAQRLMNAQQFNKAQELFQQPDWQAAAAYRAGNYAQAAQNYQNLQNEESYYNQGNALAHMNQYQQAIQAYDKALAINPHNQDALFNRKLLADLLEKNKQQDKEQQDKEQQDKEQQDKEQQGKEQQDKEQQDKEQQDKEQQDKEQQDKEQQDKEQQDKEQQDKEQQDKEQQDKEQQGKEQQGKEQQDKEQQSKEQAVKAQQQNTNQENKKEAGNNKTVMLEGEQQQAKEQWLRLIPDDPGGLMREKFLRDHIRRQRGWYQ